MNNYSIGVIGGEAEDAVNFGNASSPAADPGTGPLRRPGRAEPATALGQEAPNEPAITECFLSVIRGAAITAAAIANAALTESP
jgi:hypothetical protein